VAALDPAHLVFHDESCATTEMTRRYGWAPRGARVREGVPLSHWRTLTVLGAVSVKGLVGAMSVEAPTDREVFFAYLDQVLCPQLRLGDVVIMDNLAVHKVAGVRERIEATGAQLCYLPPYSPDLNPIESGWAAVKQRLRRVGARTVAAVEAALPAALTAFSPAQAAACFRHCGYPGATSSGELL
jgi:transposase